MAGRNGEFQENLQYPPAQRLGLPQPVGVLEQHRQVMEARGRVGVVGAQRFSRIAMRPAVQRLRLPRRPWSECCTARSLSAVATW